MIGQHKLLNTVDGLVENNLYPRFSILIGPTGSGKKLMSKYISKKLDVTPVFIEPKVDTVREMITMAYKVASPTMFIIADADSMSVGAKNALLKVTEDPPQQSYFILTLTSIHNTLSTITSRGTVFYCDPYKPQELIEYATNSVDREFTEQEKIIISNICQTPGEVIRLLDAQLTDFYDYVIKVVDNIDNVSGANAFKIGTKITFKDTEDNKYDFKLFLKAFTSICASRLMDDPIKYAKGIKVTSSYLSDLRKVGINKQATFDMWLLDIRKEWL